MLPLRKFTESEAQVREMAEDLSHFEPRRKHSRGYALASFFTSGDKNVFSRYGIARPDRNRRRSA